MWPAHPLRNAAAVLALLLTACDASTVATTASTQGEPVTHAAMLKGSSAVSGPITLTRHLAATWEVPLSGLLNLEHPKAVAAGIVDRSEPIDIYTYSLAHPDFGTYLVDSGISRKFRNPTGNEDIGAVVAMAMKTELLKVRLTTADLATELGGVAGVFLTHIHIDHIMGLPDLPADVPVYIGPGDAREKALLNSVSRGTTDRLLGVQGLLREWQFGEEGVVDVFGDGSLYAIHSPGHSPGSTAYLALTTEGPQLMIGDATHTRWGWENGVEPGSFSSDIPTSAVSLAALKELAAALPQGKVHPGHQSLD